MAAEPRADDHSPPITTVGVTTADRPGPLGRCLRSLARHLRDRADSVRVIVVDGSMHRSNESLNRSTVASIATSTGCEIAFVGRRERQAIRADLRSVGPAALIDFALTPGASGNRNIAILLTSGENVLLVDDDVVCDMWQIRSFHHALELSGHVERRDLAFCRTRLGARRGMLRARTNLLDAHQTLLGRSLESLGASMRLDPTRACRFLIEGVAGLRPAFVRTTFSGLIGDAGASNPERLLFGTGKWKTLLQSGADVYDTAFNYREVRRVASRYLITHDAACMGFCMGLANTTLVPPFLPTGRNEDGLFGMTLSAIDRTSVVGHLPYAVLHDSTRPSKYGRYAFVSASQTRVADLMIHLLSSWIPSTRASGLRPRLGRLIDWLADLARLDEPEFAETILGTIFKVRERELTFIESALRADSDYPDHWRRDLRRYRDLLLKNLRKPEFFVPVELQRGRSATAGFRSLRAFIGMSSELLAAWPAVWSEAKKATRIAVKH